MSDSSSSAPLVAVTGASGFVAGAVIAELLSRGFRVRGTVRSIANAAKVQHLRDAFPTLELFEADLLAVGSFAACFQGVDYVLHTASPFQLNVEDAQRDLVDPALKGTENVVRSAIAEPTVKRIVVTSSVAAIITESSPPDDKIFSESDWNFESTLERGPYRLSKRVAEEAAWRLVREAQQRHPERELSLAVINPAFVLGPPFSSRTDSTSIAVMKRILEGDFKAGAPPASLGCVDVRDVARAHAEAMLRPEAGGHRFILASANPLTYVDIADHLRAAGGRFAGLALPTELTAPITYRARYSNDRARTVLGIELTPLSQTVVDMANFLLDKAIAVAVAAE